MQKPRNLLSINLRQKIGGGDFTSRARKFKQHLQVRMSYANVLSSCARQNRTCPTGYISACVCPPLCLPVPSEPVAAYVSAGAPAAAIALAAFANNSAPANSTASGRFQVSATAFQRDPVVITVVDQARPLIHLRGTREIQRKAMDCLHPAAS